MWRAQDGAGPATRDGGGGGGGGDDGGGGAGEAGGGCRMLSPKLNAAALELPVKLDGFEP